MNRRKFFVAATAILPCASRLGFLPRAEAADPAPATAPVAASPDWRRFEITTRVTLPTAAGATQLWLPLAQTAGGYQIVLDLHWQGSGQTRRVHDARYGASLLHTAWNGAEGDDAPRQVEIVQTVATRDRAASPFLPLTQAERQFWTAPPAGGDVLEAARHITGGQTQERAKLRALYDWVVDHTHRDPDVPGCGTGDYRQVLKTGQLGGKCADINSLMVALARAISLPAREVYGLRVAGSGLYPCLGRSGDVSKAQHCRAEVFLEDEGWFPVDPADVRKVALEAKLSLDTAEGRALRERLFGFWEMNWVGYNSATDIELPSTDGPQKPDFAFLMYPHAVTAVGTAPCLDPARFRYEITSRELGA